MQKEIEGVREEVIWQKCEFQAEFHLQKCGDSRNIREYCPFRKLQIFELYPEGRIQRENSQRQQWRKEIEVRPWCFLCVMLSSWNLSWKQWRATKHRSKEWHGEKVLTFQSSLTSYWRSVVSKSSCYVPH